MITRIQNTETRENYQKTPIMPKASEGTGKADFSKILFDTYREQNRTFFGEAPSAVPSMPAAGRTSVASLRGRTGIRVNNAELNRIFEAASEKYQVPAALLKAVGKTESDFGPNEVSSSGAMGVMQLMPETAKYLGVENPFDPEQNIMGGAKYLAEKLKMYDGNVELALAAYNAGSGSVAKYGGIPPFKETQNYVRKVLAYMEESNG